MSEEYTLVRDIVYEHNERMHNIKKYYPFFKLAETSLSQYKEGKYAILDMGYIVMGVLRFFIEENNFRERMVTYTAYAEFIHELLLRDFELVLPEEEEKELIAYIFDKLKNDGKPFCYEYFDPAEKKKKTVRVRLINNKLENDRIVYYITSDAIEFYLDTKEIKEESNITIAQVLLEKMIANKNFKGGTEVVSRINNEVARLISKKNEILNLLGYDVFEGTKAYEEFVKNGMKWFEEEQKLFIKNKQLIDQALRTGEQDNRYFEAMDDIYHLEVQLNHAMKKHGELLSACMELQKRMDEIIAGTKLNRLKRSFDFRKVLADIIDGDNTKHLEAFMLPFRKPAIHKKFSLTIIDNLLAYRQEGSEPAEKSLQPEYNEDFRYADELEEERIYENYSLFFRILISAVKDRKRLNLWEWNQILIEKCGSASLKNVDYYSFLVHLCQKSYYHLNQITEQPETFLDEIIRQMAEEGLLTAEDCKISFYIRFDREEQQETKVLDVYGNEVKDIEFIMDSAIDCSMAEDERNGD